MPRSVSRPPAARTTRSSATSTSRARSRRRNAIAARTAVADCSSLWTTRRCSTASPTFWRATRPRPGSRNSAVSDAPDGLQPGAGVDFGMGDDRRLGTEALDHAAYEGTDAGRGHQHRRLAGLRRLLEPRPHERDELGQLRGLHRKMPVVALADDRFGEGLLPFGAERDERQVAGGRGVLRADLARQARTH